MQMKLWRAVVHYGGFSWSTAPKSGMFRVYSYYARDRETSMRLLRDEIIDHRFRSYVERIELEVVEGAG